MNKERIIDEIQRTAKANGGMPLGRRRFETETGISYYTWYGQFWTCWSDALREAGFDPNRMNEAFDEEFLLQKLVWLTRRLKKVPAQGDFLLARKSDPSFPSANVFQRLGSKRQRVSRVIAFCEASPGYDDVAALWRQASIAEPSPNDGQAGSAPASVGYVYLLKHGSRREYKIGRTYNPLRREGEVGIELPERLQPIHYIETDDPAGIENYWHSRFASKRKQGEWFALTAEDIRAFKRWRRIY
jgi:hypothetical protein